MFPIRVLRLVLSIVAVIGFIFTGSVRAVDLYNTLAQPSLGVDSISTQYGDGLSFKTTATDYVVDTVKIPLQNDAFTPASSGNVTISIYNANGSNSRPGSIIGTPIGTVPVSSLTTSSQTFTFSSLNRTLSPSTNYYIVINSTDITSGVVRTSITDNNTGAITTGSLGYSFYNNSWGGPTAGYWVKGSISTVAVPEPTTYALAAIATSVMAAVARRRKARMG